MSTSTWLEKGVNTGRKWMIVIKYKSPVQYYYHLGDTVEDFDRVYGIHHSQPDREVYEVYDLTDNPYKQLLVPKAWNIPNASKYNKYMSEEHPLYTWLKGEK